MLNTLKRLISDERGLETIEYAVMTSLLVAGLIASIVLVGDWVKLEFDNLYTELTA